MSPHMSPSVSFRVELDLDPTRGFFLEVRIDYQGSFLHIHHRSSQNPFGAPLSGVRKRSFRKGVSGSTCLVFPGTFLFASERTKGSPGNFDMKRLFRNTFSEHSKRSEKERDERSLHAVPGPCSQVRPFLLAELKRDTPRNFNMKRLIRNAFSERPTLNVEFRVFRFRGFGGVLIEVCRKPFCSQETPRIATALASYRVEKPRNPENRRKNRQKMGILYFSPIFPLFFAYFSSYFLELGVFLFCSWPTQSQPKKKHINKFLPTTQSRDIPAYLFMCFSLRF